MSPPNQKKGKKSRKGTRRGMPASSDLSTSAGRGPNIPRANILRDTLMGLAQSQRRTLAYVQNINATSTTAAYAETTTFTLNNVFSPSGGASAVGYAKYMAFYSKAWVLGVRVTTHLSVAPSAGNIWVGGITITTNNTSLGTTLAAIENGMCSYAVGNVNPDTHKLVQSVDVARFLNKPRILDDPQLFCTSAAGPTQLIVLHSWFQALTGTITGTFLHEIEFDVVFTDPIPFT